MSKPTKEKFPLRGVYGELVGNEDAVLSRLPIFEFEGRLLAGRKPRWSEKDPTSTIEIRVDDGWPGVDQAHDPSLTVGRGEVVGVVGPRLWPNLRAFLDEPRRWRRSWGETEDGVFRARAMSLEEFETLLSFAERKAMEVFDENLASTFGRELTVEGQRALAVLVGTPTERYKEHFFRMAAAKRALRNGDGYVRTLKVASVLLEESFVELDAQVTAWVRTVCGGSPEVETITDVRLLAFDSSVAFLQVEEAFRTAPSAPSNMRIETRSVGRRLFLPRKSASPPARQQQDELSANDPEEVRGLLQ